MAVKTFHIFFIYLNLFLITPWYDFDKNSFYRPRLSKLYGCCLIITKVGLITLSLMTGSLQEIFRGLVPSQKIIYSIAFIDLVLLTVITIIKSCFLDRSNWNKLLKNYHYIDKKISQDNFGLSWKLLRKQLIFLVVASYNLYVQSKTHDLSLIKIFPVLSLPYIYYKFMIVTLSEIVVEKVKNGYVYLNRNLENCSQRATFLDEVRILTQDYRILGETVDIYNQLFGYQMILIVFHCGLDVVSSLNFGLASIITAYDHPFFSHVFISNMNLLIFSLVSIHTSTDFNYNCHCSITC